MAIKSERDLGAGLVFALAGGGCMIWALPGALGPAANPGPGYISLVLGALLTLIGLVVLLKGLVVARDGGDRVGPLAWRPLLLVSGAVPALGLTPWLGLPLALALVGTLVALARPGRPSLRFAAGVALGLFVAGLPLAAWLPEVPLWPSWGAAA